MLHLSAPLKGMPQLWEELAQSQGWGKSSDWCLVSHPAFPGTYFVSLFSFCKCLVLSAQSQLTCPHEWTEEN